jgi:TetR/AcrR family transcriptional regulator
MFNDWNQFPSYIIQAEQQGRVTRTFRRLDPARQQAVLQAILNEAGLRGPSALSIKQVAQRAGVAVGSLYQYFGDRDSMLNFAVDLCVRFVSDTFEMYQSYLVTLPLREALSAYVSGGIEWSRAEAGFLQLFARAAYQGDPELAERLVLPISKKLRQMVNEMLVQAAARGEIRPGVDLETAARLVYGLSIVAADSQLLPYLNNYFQIISPGLPPERILAALLDLILNGIARECYEGDRSTAASDAGTALFSPAES